MDGAINTTDNTQKSKNAVNYNIKLPLEDNANLWYEWS